MTAYPPGLDRWAQELAPALGLNEAEVPTALLLDVTRDVAHSILRPAGPITTYLIGLAVANGMSAEDAAARVHELVEKRSAE
ncbi:hypothetical protein ACN95_08865 [Gordonia sihwensis]|uniref:DUF6457 domain-containing protein n=1 Tax=Gordonia TaxID=2053 RepID=UPI001C930733|nr:DUF6457 domain-containing protein [Gordonia sihwensis]MBY4570127.1 hypothetical protein [Gordonia sihwensis]WFN92072.1 DUF6457 domain-containing protein [Gordonia sihwensis]